MKTTLKNYKVSEDMNVVNNTLLAEFLGWKECYTPLENYFDNNGDTFLESELLFHSNWNWLMKVVEKIESLGMLFKVSRWREDEVLTNGYWCTISDSFSGVEFADSAYIDDTETRIEAMYLACIEFIKWYNLQNS